MSPYQTAIEYLAMRRPRRIEAMFLLPWDRRFYREMRHWIKHFRAGYPKVTRHNSLTR